MKITDIKARQIFDSRGNPTIEADLTLDDRFMGRAAIPSGASTGKHEMLELRDGDKANYHGQGVLKAVNNVNTLIKDLLVGKENLTQAELDHLLIDLDGTSNKSHLGANAILSVSLAFAWAMSKAKGQQLFEYVGDLYGNKNYKMPRPMFNIMNGGKHAEWATDIQEYMIFPMKAASWVESIKIGTEIYLTLGKILKSKGYSINVGNEGGYAPALKSNQEALDLIVEAIETSGYKLGEEVSVGFDAAATEFYNEETGMYELKRDNKVLTKDEMIDWVVELSKKYPVVSYEDMLAEDDWESWVKLTARIGSTIQNVGDDLLVTNVERVAKAIEMKACNALLVKLNQIGSLTETLAAMKMAEAAGWNNVVYHRSGETEDVTIAHVVVGTGDGQIKTGAPSRSERVCKYNELIRIEEYLQNK